jgi:hypothetical protein
MWKFAKTTVSRSSADQGTFDKTFPLRTFVNFNAETQLSDMNKFVNLCMYKDLFQLIQIGYVGDLSPLLTSSTLGLTSALQYLKMRASGDSTSASVRFFLSTSGHSLL